MRRVCVAAAVLASTGCSSRAHVVVREPPTVYVAASVEAPEPLPVASDRPDPASPSFDRGTRWRGHYFCAQGKTDLDLRVTAVNGEKIHAVFDFTHHPTAVHGSYTLNGHRKPGDRWIKLEPDHWLEQPPGYVMVGLEGLLSADGRSFSGRITYESCDTFEVRLVTR
jgi:hypothetical protein